MKASFVLAFLGATFALAAPTRPDSYAPAPVTYSPAPYKPEPYKPEPYKPEPPKPYPSGGAYHYERDVPVMEAPEHFEVLTA